MLKRLLLTPLAVGALVLSAPATHAGAPDDASGTLSYAVPEVVAVKTVGQTTFIDATADGVITGTLTGELREEYTVTHHAKALFNTYRGVIEFEGSVTDGDGVAHAGTLRLITHGRQDPGQVFPTDVPWEARWVIVESGGGLEGVSGHGTGVLVGLDLVYTGRVHFAGR